MAELSIPTEETGPDAPDSTEEVEVSESAETDLSIDDRIYVPDKFMNEDGTVNVERLAKSYVELEKGSSSPKSETIETPKTLEENPITQEELGVMRQEMTDEGKLSEKTLEILQSKGMPRYMAESYVEGQTLIANQAAEKVMAPIGGPENYTELVNWASENLSPEDIDAYDKIMAEGDINQKTLAVEGLAARKSRESPSSPNLIMGDTGSPATSGPYSSWDQVKRAMRDPRYETDESYRESVTQRLSMSDI